MVVCAGDMPLVTPELVRRLTDEAGPAVVFRAGGRLPIGRTHVRDLRLRVRLSGRGIKTVAKKTNAVGKVTFLVRPKRKGRLTVTATKAGYQPGYSTVKVR